jgi:glycosyltransferase involved in cell wall biosynthesis
MSVPADLRALLSLVRLLRRTAPDIVIAYTIKPVLYGMIAASLAGVKQRFAIITGLGYLFADDKHGKRRLMQLLALALYRRAFARTDKVFFQNVDDEALFRRLGILRPELPSVVVNGSGVDISQFNVAPFPRAPITFLMISRLIGAKGIREYAEAAAEIRRSRPETRFLLAGPHEKQPDSIHPSELAAWEQNGTLKWLGRLDDVRPAIAGAHVLVLPSYYREGIPRSVLEAMAMGRPVITTNSPGCRETVRHGENGFLVPVRESAPLADAMRRFLDDPSIIERLGQAGRRIAETRYDVHKVNSVMLAEMGL